MLYLYGVTKSEISGIGEGFESGILTVEFKDIFAVVEEVSEEFNQEAIDKKVKDIKWLAKMGPLHERVVEKVMEKTTIIPSNFCTIFRTEENLKSMMEENYAMFKENLERLKDKREVGVKVYFDFEKLRGKIVEETEELKRGVEKSKEMSSGKAYFEERKVEDKSKELVEEKIYAYSKELFDKIKVLGLESKAKELIKKKVTGRNMLLNGVFLIDKEDKKRFKQNLNKIKDKYTDLEFQLVGPFPPYNFVER